jgi:hypothetical protein
LSYWVCAAEGAAVTQLLQVVASVQLARQVMICLHEVAAWQMSKVDLQVPVLADCTHESQSVDPVVPPVELVPPVEVVPPVELVPPVEVVAPVEPVVLPMRPRQELAHAEHELQMH